MTQAAQDMLKIYPNPIIIRDLECGETDTIEFLATNYSKYSLKLRFSLPSKSNFQLNNVAHFSLSPGLQTSRKITFKASDKYEETQLTVTSPNFEEFSIPVIFYPPSPSIEISKSNFDLGDLSLRFPQTQFFKITNFGTKDGNFTITCRDKDVEIFPSTGFIASNQTHKIQVGIEPTKVGPVKYVLNVVCETASIKSQEVIFNGNVQDHSVQVFINKEERGVVEFGRAFFGEKVKRTIQLVNNAPFKRMFVIQIPYDPTEKRLNSKQIFTPTPIEGEIEGNTTKDIVFMFHPPIEKVEGEEEIFYEHETRLDIVKTPISVPIKLTGSAVPSQFKISCLDFQFGEILVNTHASQEMEIENYSTTKDLTFVIPKVGHYHFTPENGVIRTNSKKIITVSFDPKSLGVLNTSTTIEFCNGLVERHIVLSGTAVTTMNMGTKARVPIWETDPNVAFDLEHPRTKYGMTREDIKVREKKKEEFAEFIQEQTMKRKEAEMREKLKEQARTDARHLLDSTIKEYTEDQLEKAASVRLRALVKGYDDPLTFGFDHADGLEPPAPPVEQIMSARAPRNKSGNIKVAKGDKKGKPGKQFRTKPTTNVEIAECSKPLSPSQQLSVFMDKEKLEFGEVPVTAKKVLPITFTNNLAQHVFVVLKTDDYPEFALTKPNAQVVPPTSTCTFEVVLCDNELKVINRQLKYIVNNTHEGILSLTGKTIPIELSLSKQSATFDLTTATISQTMKDYVTILNPTDAVANVRWVGFNDMFTFNPSVGAIQPHESLSCEVIFKPGSKQITESNGILNVRGGPSMNFNITVNCGNPIISLDKNLIDFDLIPLGICNAREFNMKNTGTDQAIFFVTPLESEDITIIPTQGKILPSEQINFVVTARCTKPIAIKEKIEIVICGQNTQYVNITGHAENPQIELLFENLDFGKIFVGNTESRRFTIKNTGHIPAIVTLDMLAYDQFAIEYDQELGNTNLTGTQNSIINTTMSTLSSYDMTTTLKSTQGAIYKITIIAGSQVSFDLIFKPTIVGDFTFEMPLQMADNTFITSNVQPMVIAESIQSPLVASMNAIDFGLTPLYDALNPNIRPNMKRFLLRNKCNKNVSFRLDSTISDEIYLIEPKDGVVPVSEEISVVVTFRPQVADPVISTLTIYAKPEREDEIITSRMMLTGSGYTKTFRAEVDNIVLPIVPLNIKSEKTIRIINTRFIDSKLDAILPISEKNFPLSVTFPEGNMLQHSLSSTLMNVSFVSDKPMSFSTMIAIVDSTGNSYNVSVSVCTDNSVFTLYPVLSFSCFNIAYIIGRPITASTKNQIPDDFIAQFANNQGNYDDLKKMRSYKANEISINFMVSFLNAFVLSTKITQYPESFSNSGGDLLYEMIDNLSGKRNSKPGDNSTPLAKFKSLLTNLMGYGCHVSRIRPEYLLKKDDFMEFYHKKIIRQALGIDYYQAPDISTINAKSMSKYTSSKLFMEKLSERKKIIEKLYKPLSQESWLYLINQVLKSFLMTKFDAEKMGQIPGFNDALKLLKQGGKDNIYNDVNKPPRLLSGSNILSLHEGALMKWVSTYYCLSKRGMDNFVPVHSFLDLRNPQVLAACFTQLVPNAAYKHCESMEENAFSLQKLIQSLKLGFTPDTPALLHGNEPTLALMAFEVFQTLPHYVPTKTLGFECELNETITQQLTLSNPSRSEIVYTVNLSGSENFSCDVKKVVLPVAKTINIPITYFARSHNTDKATIHLLPNRPASSNAPVQVSSIVVSLVSNVLITKPIKTFNMKGLLYSPTTFTLPIKNETRRGGKFNISYQYSIKTEQGYNVPMQELKEFVQAAKSITRNLSSKNIESEITIHVPFVIDEGTIMLPDSPDTEVPLNIIFIPICVGNYKMQILLSSQQNGEFVYELNAEGEVNIDVESTTTVKCEENSKQSATVTIEAANKLLAQALAFSRIKLSSSYQWPLPENKFKDLVNSTTREILNSIMKNLETKYTVTYSSQHFTGPSEFTLKMPDSQTIPLTFHPPKAGSYTCRIVLQSLWDTRTIKINGVATPQTKNITLFFDTTAGKPILQELPFSNPSDQTWLFKITYTGDSEFEIPTKFSLKPQSQQSLPINFKSKRMGTFRGNLSINNIAKESTVNYQLQATVTEPLAEEKISIKVQARRRQTYTINLPSTFLQNGTAKVSSDIPVITFPQFISYQNGQPNVPLVLNVYALRSGVACGQLTVTDIGTNSFIWYIIEVEVSRPDPEEVIQVHTVERQPIQVTFPVLNPKNIHVSFDVMFSDNDLTGESKIIIPPKSSFVYTIDFNPLFAMKRTSYVCFYNNDEGEYNYLMNIVVDTALPCVLAPFKAMIGSSSSTMIQIGNPSKKLASFRFDVDNADVFHVMSKPTFTIDPKESKNIELKYTPSKIGTKEVGCIRFFSKDAGNWVFNVTGYGKPPQQLSPMIVESCLNTPVTASVVFSNPFSFPCMFEATLINDNDETHFKLLSKRRAYQFTEYGESQHISFTFTSNKLGQFNGTIIVSTTGKGAQISWNFPLIGIATQNSDTSTPELHGRANTTIRKTFDLPLAGETLKLKPSDYMITVDYANGNDWISKYIEVYPEEVYNANYTMMLKVRAAFSPKRPIDTVIHFKIENSQKQTWQFPVKIHVEPTLISKKLTIISTLGKVAKARLYLEDPVEEDTEFHAYFMQGSANELSISMSDGVLEPNEADIAELPFDIMFLPRTYGKLVRGTLIVDTEEAEYVFDIFGKMPDYIPPQITMPAIDTTMPESARTRQENTARRNRDQIGRVKIAKPRSARKTKRYSA